MPADLRDPIKRLGEGDRAAVRAHFVGLSGDDRRLRFGSTLATRTIVDYVNAIDFSSDVVLGATDADGALVGVAHVAMGNDGVEFGLSVLPSHRRRGIGSALFCRGIAHARERNVAQVFMHCLAENAAVMHIARRAGMEIVVAAGDADAHLILPAPASSGAGTRGPLHANRTQRYRPHSRSVKNSRRVFGP